MSTRRAFASRTIRSCVTPMSSKMPRTRAPEAFALDQLDGVGPARRRALLRHFGSAERILNATAEELEGVPGVPAKTARNIYAQLHRAGRA